jgi:hypothetical protein
VRHLRHFGRFEMNKHHVDRQREDRILVAEKEVENHPLGPYVLPRLLNVLSRPKYFGRQCDINDIQL